VPVNSPSKSGLFPPTLSGPACAIRLTIVQGGVCESVLGQFATAGVDVDALAARLQDEGAKSFVASWNELRGVIGSKSAALK
jgi:hypothetical protein